LSSFRVRLVPRVDIAAVNRPRSCGIFCNTYFFFFILFDGDSNVQTFLVAFENGGDTLSNAYDSAMPESSPDTDRKVAACRIGFFCVCGIRHEGD
jgi:hypothetical protein